MRLPQISPWLLPLEPVPAGSHVRVDVLQVSVAWQPTGQSESAGHDPTCGTQTSWGFPAKSVSWAQVAAAWLQGAAAHESTQ